MQALLRCAEHFKDLSDSEMELKMSLLALGRFRVYEECCQARVHSCLWPDLNEPEAGKHPSSFLEDGFLFLKEFVGKVVSFFDLLGSLLCACFCRNCWQGS